MLMMQAFGAEWAWGKAADAHDGAEKAWGKGS